MVLAHNLEDGERTQDVQISQGVTFDSMLLAPDTLQGLKNCGFYKPSPVQLHGIPLGKCGFDLLLEAKSGTGKTAVFSIVALEQLDLKKGLQAVFLAPTREIAAQICDVTKQIGCHYTGLKVEVVMGGLPVQDDIEKFKGNRVHIVVGSPGRLRHLILDKHINTSSIRLLVLDEADKLLEKSFLADINYIFSVIPKQKQVIMSSATYPEETKTFVKKYVQSAQHICPDSNSILLGLKQKVTAVKHDVNIVKQTKYRFDELLQILSKHAFKQCLIFCNYQARIAELHKMLRKHKWPAEQLYGQQEQLDRLDALKSLQEYKCRILISTDLAARGIDASNVDLVINFEPPFEWQTYLHRIGRAGRFGSYGIAITILSKGEEQKRFQEILKTIKTPINLTNLWEEGHPATTEDDAVETSSKSHLSEASQTECVPVELKTTEVYEKLWNLLTDDPKENKDNIIEDFDSLCSSFNSVKVDTFSDLLSSLDGYQTKEAVNGTYHHLRMTQIPIPVFCKVLSSANTCKKSRTFTNVQEEMSNNDFEDASEIQKTFKLRNVKAVSNKRNNVNTKPYNTKNNMKCNNRKAVEEANDKLEDQSTQALINAGLPTAFGKNAKLKYTFDSYISTYNTYQKNHDQDNSEKANGKTRKNRLSYKDTEDSDTSQGFYNIRAEKSEAISAKKSNDFYRKPSRKSGYDVDDENYDNGYNTTTCSNNFVYNHPNDTRTQNKPQGCKIGNNISSDTSDEDSNHSVNLSYIKWYNTLKYRVKQVEQVIYLEEMSKLYN